MYYGQIKTAGMDLALESSALRGDLPHRDYAGPVRAAKKATKYGLIGGGLGALAGGALSGFAANQLGTDDPTNAVLGGGVAGGLIGGIPSSALGALKGLLTDESQSDYLRRVAGKDPGLLDNIKAPKHRE